MEIDGEALQGKHLTINQQSTIIMLQNKSVRSIGVSNWNSKQIAEILEKGEVKPHNLQVELHVSQALLFNQKRCLF